MPENQVELLIVRRLGRFRGSAGFTASCKHSRMDPASFRTVWLSLPLVLLVLCTFATGFLVPRVPTFARYSLLTPRITPNSAFITTIRDGGDISSSGTVVAAANGVAMSASIEEGGL